MLSVILRPFTPGDEASLVEVWFTSWLSVGIDHPKVTREFLANRLPRDLAQRWDVTIAEFNGAVVGFLALVVSERRLDQLFIAPDAQGKGIGHRLFELAKQKMPDGFWLSTQPDNARARAFYERAGMRLDRIEPDPSGDRVFYKLVQLT